MVASVRAVIFVTACTLALAAPAPVTFSLPDAAGKTHSSVELARFQATVLLFVATDCPNSNTYAPVFARLYREYSPRGVQFLGIYSDPADRAATVEKHDADYRIPYAALLDPNHTLALTTGARSTPEAVILSPSGDVLYRGRVDDRFVDFGKTRFRPTREDLREALDQVLSGQPVKNPVTKVLGCAIPGVN
ncbi:MAG TPA: redoxin domain-containing protein [Bryobacteraceae bacterium]|nr:redoxin domain-containing protein [Bryobacteraceae bacterium]